MVIDISTRRNLGVKRKRGYALNIMKKNNDMAIVLKALDLAGEDDDKEINSLKVDAEILGNEIENEVSLWDKLIHEELGLNMTDTVEKEKQVIIPSASKRVSENNQSWVETYDWACEKVKSHGLDPLKIKLPPSEHDLSAKDIAFAFLIAAVTVSLPSLGGRDYSIQHWFNKIQKSADNGQITEFLKMLFGNKPAPYLDIKDGGIYHRYIFGHDLLQAIPIGISEEGLTGVVRVLQHLFRDSFGLTGFPLPGSTLFLEMVAKFSGASGISELIKNTDLSHSELARYSGIRAVDGFASIITAILLWSYHKWQKTPESSMKRPKMAIIAYGLATFGVAIATTIPGLAALLPYRSHINYVCLVGMVKNSWQLKSMAKKLNQENDRQISIIEKELITIHGISLKEEYLLQ